MPPPLDLNLMTLWDLLPRRKPRITPKPPKPAPTPRRRNSSDRGGVRQRYDELVIEMKRAYGVRIRKWRSSTTGCAWEVHYRDGSVVRLIESPYPTGPMSCAVFLHEVGHHAIGFGRYRPRCLEEYMAWQWALGAMRDRGFNVTASVEKRFHDSMRYALAKARRRGLKRIPAELAPFAG